MQRLLRTLLCSTLVLVAASAQAQVVASTFGPGDSFNTGTGWTVSNGYVGFASVAAAFSPTMSGSLSTIRAAAFGPSNADPLVVGLYSGADMNTATLLEQFTANPTSTTILSFASMSHPILTAGQSYFIAMTTGPQGWYAWNFNDQGAAGVWFQGVPTDAWFNSGSQSPAYDVTVSTTPEPASLALVATGLLSLGGLGLRRRRA